MVPLAPADIRNFAVAGHASSGKTILTEAMLLCSGAIGRMGRISEGSTVSDYHVSERQRQISTQTSLLHTNWLGKRFNILDSPGYPDFMSETLASLRVADFALVVVHAQHGAGVGTERVWNCATECSIPKVLVVNAIDKEHANFENVVGDLRAQYGRIFPMNIPVNPGPGFNQILDVLRSDIVNYETTGHSRFSEKPAVGPWKKRVSQLHQELIELIAESDDTLLNKFFDQGSLSEEEFRSGIHSAIQAQIFTPVFCVSAETGVGVARLMDFVAKYGSSPVDRQKVAAVDGSGQDTEVRLTDPEPVAQIFKTMNEEQFGELWFFRVYSGGVKTGSDLFNSSRGAFGRIGQIYHLNGHNRLPINDPGPADCDAPVNPQNLNTRT